MSENENSKSGWILAFFWLGLILISYPRNWKDTVLVGIFLAVIFVPPLLFLGFGLAFDAEEKRKKAKGIVSVPLGTEPPNGVYEISCSDTWGPVFLGIILGGFTAWLTPIILNQPSFPVWAREPHVGWGVGFVVMLLFMGIDYQDVIQVKVPARTTRFRYYGIPVYYASNRIPVPYNLSWVWHVHKIRTGQYSSQTSRYLVLKPDESRAITLQTYEEGNVPGLERLNELGKSFDAWNNGLVFQYTPLDSVPPIP